MFSHTGHVPKSTPVVWHLMAHSNGPSPAAGVHPSGRSRSFAGASKTGSGRWSACHRPYCSCQARQAFVASSIKARPELPTEVLLPTLLMAAKDALDACSPAVSLLSGAQSLPLPSLASLIDGLLRPKRQIRLPYVAVEPVLAGHLSDELVRYSPETRVAAATLLTGVKESIKLSELLTHARAQGHGIDVLEVLILLILQSFGRDRETTALVSVEPVPGLSLIDEDFLGDELLIGPAKKTRARKR